MAELDTDEKAGTFNHSLLLRYCIVLLLKSATNSPVAGEVIPEIWLAFKFGKRKPLALVVVDGFTSNIAEGSGMLLTLPIDI